METVVIQNANAKPEPSLEDQAKAAGIDVTSVDSTATEQNAVAPAKKILGKFETPEALEAAYVELEKKLNGEGAKEETPAENTEPKKGDETEADPEGEAGDKTAEEQAEKAADEAGLDLDALSDKYWENGDIDASDYEALEKAGYPKHMVDEFIEGRVAVLELQTAKVHLAVGGEDAYNATIEWAKTALTPKEIATYDKAVNSQDMDVVIEAAKGLKARFDNEVGFEPTRVVGGRSNGSTDGGTYASLAEMKADMANPKYQTDPAYRKMVEAKLSRSDIL